MSFDGIVMRAVQQELSSKLAGGRVNRVYQPDATTLVLHIYNQGDNHRLLLSNHANHARIHLTGHVPPNPQVPPTFCMLLRKHLEGGRITAITQPGLDRILQIRVEIVDEIGYRVNRLLISEVMGKHSNILLVDPVTGLILDGIRRYSRAVSRHREVLPGRPYLPPPTQCKDDPFQLTEDSLVAVLLEGEGFTQSVEKRLLSVIEGLGPVTAREVVARAGLAPDTPLAECGELELSRLWQALKSLFDDVAHGHWHPVTVVQENRVIAFHAITLQQFPAAWVVAQPSISAAVDSYYAGRQAAEQEEQLRHQLKTVIGQELRKSYRKLERQETELAQAKDAEQYKMAGELITANIYRLEQGMEQAVLENFYDPDGKRITIPLAPELSPAENAQAYFRKYVKAKNALRQATSHIQLTREEIAYLEGLQYMVETAMAGELKEIRLEMEEQGYLKPATPGRGKTVATLSPSEPLAFTAPDGTIILVGRNNRQNDRLTFKIAGPEDLWLHVKGHPGSHVVIRQAGEITSGTLLAAALLAAHFSSVRSGGKVEVDYTAVRHVRKPRGARPGMVIYDHHQSIAVSTDHPLLQQILHG